MGFFFKKKPKEYVVECRRCKKEFIANYDMIVGLCPDCSYILREKQLQARGYIDYGQMVYGVQYAENHLDNMILHRNCIMEKYQETTGITRAELQPYANYYQYSEDQITEMLFRAQRSVIYESTGALYKPQKFFALSAFDGVVVDIENIFAIGMVSSKKYSRSYEEVVICAFFTNDPYIPVFPAAYSCDKGLLGSSKGKNGKQSLANELLSMCPNLKYPVVDMKQLKQQVLTERMVRGNLDMKFMVDKMMEAVEERGLFDIAMLDAKPTATVAYQLIDDYGYLRLPVFNEVLHMDWRAEKKFWDAQMQRVFGKPQK